MSLATRLPREYRWRYSSVESFRSQAARAKTVGHFNQLFWTDFARNWEAYALMSYWRGMEIIEPAIRSLNAKELIAPAVLARSLLELSASFLWNANQLDASVRDVPTDPHSYAVSDEFEKMVNKAIWGTRLAEPDDPLYQKSVLTVLQKVSKAPNAEELYPTYEFLCEVAHPNVVGNARFWSHVERIDEDGREIRVMSRTSDAEHLEDLFENTMWALAWGGAVLANSFLISEAALERLLEKTAVPPVA